MINNVQQALMKTVVTQFKQPTGWLGNLAGFIMAKRPSNRERNAWTLELLDLQPTDRVLEIGFGPGIAIEKASQIVTDGLIVGIDHSKTMLRQASKRNQSMIAKGKVKLYLGTIAQLNHFNEPFNKIFSANVVQFWADPVAEFKILRQYLAPQGIIATTFQPRQPGATAQDATQMGEKIIQALKTTGFSETTLKIKPMKPVSVVCAMGYLSS